MSINVLYFASLKEAVGRGGDELNNVESPQSARQIWAVLNPDLPIPDAVLVAINLEYVGLDAMVNDGDELAFFPPVTGG